MSDASSFAAILHLQTPKSPHLPSNHLPFSRLGSSRFVSDLCACLKIKDDVNARTSKPFTNFSQQGSIPALDSSSPVSIDLKPILNERQFDQVIAESKQLQQSVVILWMANWCRKCIYLKPKLEKLAANYHPRVRFYCIDVNNVPYHLVVRAGVTKMPTIQLWKDGKKQAEVIGGHKAYLVANEVREMIDDEGQP
ncbi:hypothetical protein L1987_75771 [Smallanthus sonchifolius]|uniref:Uncharacterized protein n=1 Tax=Smallanthus sonchifolius TaxID=185202 RepID=A0ACB9A5P7_9ASTR|nr:hypothetical protein L1987_75771 [Smallanthus sonchifolius]